MLSSAAADPGCAAPAGVGMRHVLVAGVTVDALVRAGNISRTGKDRLSAPPEARLLTVWRLADLRVRLRHHAVHPLSASLAHVDPTPQREPCRLSQLGDSANAEGNIRARLRDRLRLLTAHPFRQGTLLVPSASLLFRDASFDVI